MCYKSGARSRRPRVTARAGDARTSCQAREGAYALPRQRSKLANAKYWQIAQISQQSDHFWTCTWSNVNTLFRSGLPNSTGATVTCDSAVVVLPRAARPFYALLRALWEFALRFCWPIRFTCRVSAVMHTGDPVGVAALDSCSGALRHSGAGGRGCKHRAQGAQLCARLHWLSSTLKSLLWQGFARQVAALVLRRCSCLAPGVLLHHV